MMVAVIAMGLTLAGGVAVTALKFRTYGHSGFVAKPCDKDIPVEDIINSLK